MTMLDTMRRHKEWLKWFLGLVVLAFVVAAAVAALGPQADQVGMVELVFFRFRQVGAVDKEIDIGQCGGRIAIAHAGRAARYAVCDPRTPLSLHVLLRRRVRTARASRHLGCWRGSSRQGPA
mgnify:CR=1 FL=1